ncbi:MAG TPA: ubiquinone/menaquinone biosynthesis methyltransferase [Dehalococcoidia bacterium]|nr:ubiquinone/menaquinone biosynthesis methyltransferase [Dehalococcoidia bacterium]
MPARDPRQVRAMFGRIVPRYDLLNRLMSLGMDGRWRIQAARAARPPGVIALDLGTGTGDMTIELRQRGASRVIGADFSRAMLGAASRKTEGTKDVSFVLADALSLPFPDATFDVLVNSFLLRNLANLPAGLAEMSRVLRPGGRLVCLDMTQPPAGIFGTAYRFYFNRLLPPLAGALSGDRAAYRYLPHSLRGVPDAAALAGMLREAGLENVRVRLLGGGAVALHTAVRAAPRRKRKR